MKPSQASFQLMGTVIDLMFWHEEPEWVMEQVEHLLYLYQNRFSAHDLTSHLTEVNLNAGVQPVFVDQDVYDLIAIGKEHSCAENSYLNIAIGPLVSAWQIASAQAKRPLQEELEKALACIDPEAIELLPDTREIYLTKEGMSLDLGALAKGYIADQMVDHMKRIGVSSGFINLGGSVRTFGKQVERSDGTWRIGIQDPKQKRGQYVAVLTVAESSVVTLGIYERQFVVDHQIYHLILDSKTGYPINSPVASLTIVSEQALDGEIWTSRLFGMKPADIESTIEEQAGLEAVIISNQGEIRVTSGLLSSIEPSTDLIDTYSAATVKPEVSHLVADTRSGASLL